MAIMSVLAANYISTLADLAKYPGNYIVEQGNFIESSVRIEYEEELLTFRHFRWNIVDASVCEHVQSTVLARANCTKSAKRFFKAVCEEMAVVNHNSIFAQRMARMYCRAANRYQPLVAEIALADELTELEQAKVSCNAAIAAAAGDPSRVANRQRVCEEYEALRIAAEQEATE
ncbi:hypothetical protein [uncultured Umboniibacter sp.]|uniref:hypothetical protein n=1 Tax=uncultured Umboniibacter sp. TaxID=1798917 RepID=UPI002608FC13|nr:hypothetical protein [uncultured Umboniibacter sp.]